MVFSLPTDTCYGLAWDFTTEDYHEIYRLKGRSFDKRLAALVRDLDMLREYADVSDEQIEFLRNYPFPWSVILPRKHGVILPRPLQRSEYEYISFRVWTECLKNIDIHANLSFPLFLTSANFSGWSESTTLEEAKKIFPWIDWIDGGICDMPPSDIFRFLSNGEVEYIRQNYQDS